MQTHSCSACEASEFSSTKIAKQLHVKISFTICSKILFPHRLISSFWIRFEMYLAFFDALLIWWNNATSPLFTLNAKSAKISFHSHYCAVEVQFLSSWCPRSAIRSLLQRRIVSTIGTNLFRFSSAALRCCSDNWYARSSEESDTHFISLCAFSGDN